MNFLYFQLLKIKMKPRPGQILFSKLVGEMILENFI